MGETAHDADCRTLIGALEIARERVTGVSVAAKQDRRDELKAMISAMYHYLDTGQDQPSSDDLRNLLGTLDDDRVIREALQHWD
jgi:hypothetical protein